MSEYDPPKRRKRPIENPQGSGIGYRPGGPMLPPAVRDRLMTSAMDELQELATMAKTTVASIQRALSGFPCKASTINALLAHDAKQRTDDQPEL